VVDPNPNNFPHVPISEIKITGIEMFHELLTRIGFRLPHVKSRFITLKLLLLIRDHKIYGLKEADVFYKACT
jgi:hypothetical protein